MLIQYFLNYKKKICTYAKNNTCIACTLSTSENYKITNMKTVNINYSFTNIFISPQHLISRRVDRGRIVILRGFINVVERTITFRTFMYTADLSHLSIPSSVTDLLGNNGISDSVLLKASQRQSRIELSSKNSDIL